MAREHRPRTYSSQVAVGGIIPILVGIPVLWVARHVSPAGERAVGQPLADQISIAAFSWIGFGILVILVAMACYSIERERQDQGSDR